MAKLSFEAAKKAGDEATKRGDYAEAEAHYTEALAALGDVTCCAAVLCNRSFTRLQQKDWRLAIDDATAALSAQPEEKLRVKALFRRGLAHEALGELEEARDDLSLALKSAPGNDGILTAAKRVRASLQQGGPSRHSWVSGQPYITDRVAALAEAVPGCVRGYLGTDEDPCVRFPNRMGVQIHHRTGRLLAIWQRLGPPQQAPDAIVTTNYRDYKESPNFDRDDGISIDYDIGGNLKAVHQRLEDDLNGPWLTFNADGSLNLRETCCYRGGRVVSKLKSDVPERFVEGVLREVLLPLKRALDIGLAPGEEELCARHGVDASLVQPAELAAAGHGPEKPPRLKPFRAPEPRPASDVSTWAEGVYGAAWDKPEPAPGPPRAPYGYGMTWEELMQTPPEPGHGAGGGGTAPDQEPGTPGDDAETQEGAPDDAKPGGAVETELLVIQGAWVDEMNDTPVGKIEGGFIVWHRSFNAKPTKLELAGDGRIRMKLESATHHAVVENGLRTRLRWSDGDVWIRTTPGVATGVNLDTR